MLVGDLNDDNVDKNAASPLSPVSVYTADALMIYMRDRKKEIKTYSKDKQMCA